MNTTIGSNLFIIHMEEHGFYKRYQNILIVKNNHPESKVCSHPEIRFFFELNKKINAS